MSEVKLPMVKLIGIEGDLTYCYKKIVNRNRYTKVIKIIIIENPTYSFENPNPDWKIKGEKWIEYALAVDKSNYVSLNCHDIAYMPHAPIAIIQGYSEHYIIPTQWDAINCCCSLDDILETDDDKFINFTKDFYGAIWDDAIKAEKINWLNSAKIERTNANKVIRIFNQDREIVFNINDMNTEILVKADDMGSHHYTIRTKNNMSEVYKIIGNFSYVENAFSLIGRSVNPTHCTIGSHKRSKHVDLSPSDDAEVILDLLKFAEIIYDAPII